MPTPEATNSLVVLFDTFSDDACVALRTRLEECGTLCHFAKLKSFARCLAVFQTTADAQCAMRTLNSTSVLSGNSLRVYYSNHTLPAHPLHDFLNVPTQEKLWLISPPGSPPIDWRQTRELPPNATHLDRRLEAALQELGLGQFALDPAAISDDESMLDVPPPDADLSPQRLLPPSATTPSCAKPDGISVYADVPSSSSGFCPHRVKSTPCVTPTILIQNCDIRDKQPHQDSSSTGISSVARPPTFATVSQSHRPTPRPPPHSASTDM
ncbi:hypothetical protein COEREDRAFT_12195 [Coemansia reversa NRRL 1564]|uniref:Calcipressin n=1 Tax=Coemansia reversa (strain ATCC 12441 / NRRL 1564) TaxID=763665 RepID=A0A2G5B1A8_COERN|nr:hypothetical protein COEREDRAFT_12195 [Coemansia reversa NRRL 1564]|eukprot:PIA12792.1 hypothetical protein COEREDRAFT_12195 [Coemansia reversa NRRL 1564]